jgi:hypothetical protein
MVGIIASKMVVSPAKASVVGAETRSTSGGCRYQLSFVDLAAGPGGVGPSMVIGKRVYQLLLLLHFYCRGGGCKTASASTKSRTYA